MLVSSFNGGQGPGYSSQEKISTVSFWSAPAFFFIGEIKSVASENNYNSYEGTGIFLYSDGSKKEYSVYTSSGAIGSVVRADSVFFFGPQDYDMMSGAFKVRILTDTGMAYYSGNLFSSGVKVRQAIVSASNPPLNSAAHAVRYSILGRRIAIGQEVIGLNVVRLPNGVTVMSSNLARLRYK